jgi:hypothetical protein
MTLVAASVDVPSRGTAGHAEDLPQKSCEPSPTGTNRCGQVPTRLASARQIGVALKVPQGPEGVP